ncbi:hypothetical protein L6248_02690 [Candidatus Parcubacteria bacterium]|nr:hypothetical protein [Candidatus Parcubacteria bacterium]
MFNKSKCQIKNLTILAPSAAAALGAVVFISVFLFSAGQAKAAEYYKQGTVLSTNLLNGLEDVAIIQSFDCIASVSASTTVSAQFSQDGINWFNRYGYKGWWDSCADGVTNIDLTALEWTSANFYYKLKFETSSSTLTAAVSEVRVNYSDEYTPPAAGQYGYHKQGTLVSANLLDGLDSNLNGSEKFGYNISSLPAGTAVYAQFSQDGENWYNSSGTKWGWDTLSAGSHLEKAGALGLSG